MLCELAVSYDLSLLSLWALLCVLGLVAVFFSSGVVFYIQYVCHSYEQWCYKTLPTYPSASDVRLEILATLKGMATTLKHLVDPHKVTMQYPETKWDLSPRWRGTHRMLTTETGAAKCVACGLCPSVCPANCIKLVPGEDEQGNRYPLVFEIDEFRCIFCGYCQEVCPEEAIHLGRHYENAEFDRAAFVYDLERLTAQTHPVSELWDPADPKGE